MCRRRFRRSVKALSFLFDLFFSKKRPCSAILRNQVSLSLYVEAVLNADYVSPGHMSAVTGHHYANPTNHFWHCLHLSGTCLIPASSPCPSSRKKTSKHRFHVEIIASVGRFYTSRAIRSWTCAFFSPADFLVLSHFIFLSELTRFLLYNTG